MRAYIHDNKTGGIIRDICEDLDIGVLSAADILKRSLDEHGDAEGIPRTAFFLNEVDVLVLEVTHPTPEVQFILAQAIIADKPTLCLYAKNQGPKDLLQYIRHKKAPRPIKTFSYVKQSLPTAVEAFLRRHNDALVDYDDAPSIKFTLRLSPRIERFLSWSAGANGISKADVIRELLSETAQKTDEFVDKDIFDSDSE